MSREASRSQFDVAAAGVWSYIGGIAKLSLSHASFGGSALKLTRPGLAAAGVLLVVAALFQGCDDSDDDDSSSGSTFTGFGYVQTSPDIEGTWLSTTTITSSACGSGIPSFAVQQIVNLAQSDTSLTVDVFSLCGSPLSTGAGTISHQGGASLAFEQSIVLTDACTLNIQITQSGLVQTNLQNIGGSTKITITGVGDCDDDLPCELNGKLLMQRCPPATCTFQTCQP